MKDQNVSTVKAQLSDRVKDFQQRAGETARQFSSNADDYVRENPWQTVAIVAAAALLIGLLIGRSSD